MTTLFPVVVSPLRQRLIDEMDIRRFGYETQRNYIRDVGQIACNSCRIRHCPRCQGAAARTWLAEREAGLLPVGYFHVVFTLPAGVADLVAATLVENGPRHSWRYTATSAWMDG